MSLRARMSNNTTWNGIGIYSRPFSHRSKKENVFHDEGPSVVSRDIFRAVTVFIMDRKLSYNILHILVKAGPKVAYVRRVRLSGLM